MLTGFNSGGGGVGFKLEVGPRGCTRDSMEHTAWMVPTSF